MIEKIKYKAKVNGTLLAEWMIGRAGKKSNSFLDKMILSLLNKMVSTKHLENDYMADEWLESEPGFTIEELEAYENGKG